MTTLHVHYPSLKAGEHARILRERLPALVRLTDAEETGLDDAAVLVDGRPTPELLAQLPALRAVVIPWAGVSEVAHGTLSKRPDLAVHNLHHNAAPVTEHAIGLLLAAARGIVPSDQALRAGDWRPRYAESTDPLLSGGNAVVVGAGAIGRRVARALKGLGMKAQLVGRTAREGVCSSSELPRLLADCSALILALPLTEASRGLIGAAELALLPDAAVLVNVGRAELCEEDALYDALRGGHLRAGLDVWYRYPEDEVQRASTMPSRHAFGELPNVVLSPHRAGHGAATPRLRAEALAELLAALAAGEAPRGSRVDLTLGY